MMQKPWMIIHKRFLLIGMIVCILFIISLIMLLYMNLDSDDPLNINLGIIRLEMESFLILFFTLIFISGLFSYYHYPAVKFGHIIEIIEPELHDYKIKHSKLYGTTSRGIDFSIQYYSAGEGTPPYYLLQIVSEKTNPIDANKKSFWQSFLDIIQIGDTEILWSRRKFGNNEKNLLDDDLIFELENIKSLYKLILIKLKDELRLDAYFDVGRQYSTGFDISNTIDILGIITKELSK